MLPREKIIVAASGKPGNHGFQHYGPRDAVGTSFVKHLRSVSAEQSQLADAVLLQRQRDDQARTAARRALRPMDQMGRISALH
jgi:hypothetical protein